MRADKSFLLGLLPLALVAFVSGPLAVLHSFGLLIHQGSLDGHGPLTSDWGPVKIAEAVETLPEEIPLMFQMDRYPATGHKAMEVRDLRLLSLSAFAALQNVSRTEAPVVALLGYLSIVDMMQQQELEPGSYPEGELLRITDISSRLFDFDGEAPQKELLVLDSQRTRRFRLKTVRHDEPSGLLFGRVDWIEDEPLM